MNTTDLSLFGHRERQMAEELLKAWRAHGLPDDFEDDEVTIMFNPSSGYVFLTNSEYQAAMEADGTIESWYNCPECGHEGFKEDMEHGEGNEDCVRYLKDINAA